MRKALITSFLSSAGWGGARLTPLPGDASFRRYARVDYPSCIGQHRKAMVMDAPPPQEDVRPFLAIAKHLCGLGFSAPTVLASDPDNGLLLIEDLGDDTYTRRLAEGADEEALYRLAVDVLIHLHRLDTGMALPEGLPTYDLDKLLNEARLLTDWYVPAVLGHGLDTPELETYDTLWRDLLKLVLGGPQTLVLRDFHVDNLMSLAGREGIAACGLLDFQDAVAGHPAYDLMSLLEDARRDLTPSLEEALLSYYLDAFPALDRERFETAYAILGAQRHAKVIGIFTRLRVRDNKDVYLKHIPRVWRLLEGSCRHPHLAPFKQWLDRNIPDEMRRIPPCTVAP